MRQSKLLVDKQGFEAASSDSTADCLFISLNFHEQM